jgi:nucleoside-diphosphate-sugar epimerase
MDIFITGGAGFIGSHLIERLIKKGFNIIILVKDLNSIKRLSKFKESLIIYDVNTPLNEIFEKHNIDLVIHLATYYKKDHSSEDVKDMIQTNITLPNLILEEMVKHNVKYFINTGSFFEYDLKTRDLISEESVQNPYNFYSSLKVGFRNILEYYCKNKGIKAIDLKLFSPYGPGDNLKLILFLINSVLENNCVEISKGEQELNWTYVEDIVDAYLKSIDYILNMGSNFESFNICSNEIISIQEIVKLLEGISGRIGLIKCVKEYRDDEIMYAKGDNNKAKRVLGWHPNYLMEKGLKKTYDYYKNGI